MRRKRVQAEQRGMKGGVERGRPRVRIGGRSKGGACPGESGAALMDVLDGGAGGGDARVGEESGMLRLWWYRDLGGRAQFGESESGWHD